MAIIDELLQPLNREEFQRNIYLQKPFAAPQRALRFRKLISWPLLFEIFASGHDDCWLPKNGRLPEDPKRATGCLPMDVAIHAFEAEGRTVLVRHSERAHASMRSIADDFQKAFADPI